MKKVLFLCMLCAVSLAVLPSIAQETDESGGDVIEADESADVSGTDENASDESETEAGEAEKSEVITINIEMLPQIDTLSYKDDAFKQYASAVEEDNKARASGREREWLIYKYQAQEGDTLRAIASRCCIREETLATINCVASIREEIKGRMLLLPAFNAVFIAAEPQNAFETLIAHDTSYEEYVAKTQNLCYNINGRLFMVADGAKINGTERLFFLDESYQMPVEGAYLSSRYGMRISPISGKRKFHNGIDLAVAEGTAVHPCKSGMVERCGWGDAVFGNYIVLSHHGGVTSLYAHLSKILAKEGETVGTASVIGRVGHTGMATGPHLHFEIKTDGKNVDPRKVLG